MSRLEKAALVSMMVLLAVLFSTAVYVKYIHKPYETHYIDRVFKTTHITVNGKPYTKVYTYGQGVYSFTGNHTFQKDGCYRVEGYRLPGDLEYVFLDLKVKEEIE